MTEQQRRDIIDLTTRLQNVCIAYGRAIENDPECKNGWTQTVAQKWKVAEDDLREYLDKA